MSDPEIVNDSDILNDAAQLNTIKKVLAREFGVTTAALLAKVEEYEDKAANTDEVTLTMAESTLAKMLQILQADGSSSETLQATEFAEWLDDKIEAEYSSYAADGRFDNTESEPETPSESE